MICNNCGKETCSTLRAAYPSIVCPECYKEIVSNINIANRLYNEVIDKLEVVGFERLKGEVKLSLIDEREMVKVMNKKHLGYFHGLISPFASDIKVLQNLTKEAFLDTIAHEHIHAWMHYNTPLKNNIKLCEGIAQLGGYLLSRQYYSAKMSYYLHYNLFVNPDPIYGEQFRYLNDVMQKYGITYIIEKIRNGEKL